MPNMLTNQQLQKKISDLEKELSELKTKNSVLQETENIYHDFSENTRDVFIVWSYDNEILHVNNRFVDVFEADKSSFINNPQSFFDFIHPEDKELVFKKFIKARKDNLLNFDLEFRIKTKNSVEKWLWYREHSVLSFDKVFKRLVLISDISSQKVIISELKESKELFTKAFFNTSSIIFITDLQGNIIDVNNSFIKYLGFYKNELIGKKLSDLKISYSSDSIRLLTNSEYQLSENEIKLVAKNGAIKFGIISNDLIKLKGKSYYFNVLNDISDVKKAEIKLTSKNEELSAAEEELSAMNDELKATVEELDFKNRIISNNLEEIKESERKFRLLFEQSADAILLIENQKYIDCNEATVQMLGYKNKNDLLNMHPSDISPEFQPDGKKSLLKAGEMMNMAYKKRSHRFEWIHRRANGEDFPVEVLLTAIPVGDKELLYTVWRDISDRKIAENALKESEAIVKAIFNQAFQFIGILDKEGRIKDANNSAVKILQISKRDLMGQFFWDTPWWSHSTEEQNKLKHAIKRGLEGKFSRFETFHMDHNNEKVYVDFSLKPLYDENGEILFLIPEGRDITDRKLMEQALRVSELKFKSIYDNSLDAIIISDFKGLIIDANKAFYNLLNIKEQNVELFDIVSEENRNILDTFFQNININKAAAFIEIELQAIKGNKVLVEINGKIIEYENEEVILIIARDIREQKQIQRKILEAMMETEEKERGRLASDLHDDIGPILSSMNMYISFIEKLDDVRKQKYIIDQLKELNNEAISSIRIISNTLSPNILNYHGIHAAVNLIIDQNKKFLPFIFKSNIEALRFDIKIETVFYRVVKELLNNTLKHADAREIQISIIYKNEVLELNYADNGKGFNLEAIRKEKTGGIGLFNVLNRINTINGKYDLDTKPGAGFKFRLKVFEINPIEKE